MRRVARRRLRWWGVALLLALLLVSCDGNEPPGAVDAEVASYAEELTRITDQYRRSVLEVAIPEDGDAADVLGNAAVTMWSYIGAIAALEPPSRFADEHEAYVAAFTASATYMNEATAALEGVAVEDMNATLTAAFGSTAADLGGDVAAACVALERAVDAAGMGISLGCDG